MTVMDSKNTNFVKSDKGHVVVESYDYPRPERTTRIEEK